jgi:hypothetical protein
MMYGNHMGAGRWIFSIFGKRAATKHSMKMVDCDETGDADVVIGGA